MIHCLFIISPLYPLVNIQKAIEHGPVEIVSFPSQHGGSSHSYVSLPIENGDL